MYTHEAGPKVVHCSILPAFHLTTALKHLNRFCFNGMQNTGKNNIILVILQHQRVRMFCS